MPIYKGREKGGSGSGSGSNNLRSSKVTAKTSDSNAKANNNDTNNNNDNNKNNNVKDTKYNGPISYMCWLKYQMLYKYWNVCIYLIFVKIFNKN